MRTQPINPTNLYYQLLAEAGLTREDFESLLVSSPGVYLEVLTKMHNQPFKLEPYQVRFLNDQSRYRLVNKARQIGFSTVISAEGMHRAATRSGYTANFISINQDEARDKINIARNLYHSIPDEMTETGFKPVIWTDSEDTLGFHGPPHTSQLVSKPASSAVRGGKKDIYFDEAAHIRDFSKLYQAALPAIIRGEGRITLVSTPMDESGLFFDVATDESAYPNFSRHSVPWWEASIMVKDGWLEEAMAEAPALDTQSRVEKYGNETLLGIFGGFGVDIMSFQTEFECKFVDELAAYYPWELILDSTPSVETKYDYFRGNMPENWQPEGSLTLGIDLAKERDQSVFILVEHIERGDGEVDRYVRWIHSTQAQYADQAEFLIKLVKKVKPNRVSIDKTGVGNVLHEQLSQHFTSEGVIFTQAKKEGWATKFKGELQDRLIHLPNEAELLKQIHGIRRTKSENSLYKFSGKHDDYFWALMLACYGEGRMPVRFHLL